VCLTWNKTNHILFWLCAFCFCTKKYFNLVITVYHMLHHCTYIWKHIDKYQQWSTRFSQVNQSTPNKNTVCQKGQLEIHKYFLQAEINKYFLHWDFITSSVYTGFCFFGVPFKRTGFNVTLKRSTCKMDHCLQYLSFK